MNPLILEQLKKCRVARIPEFDENTTFLEIPQVITASYEPGQRYIIELDDYLLKSCTIHTNWNNNILPTSKYYKCEYIKTIGKMIKIVGVEYNPETEESSNLTWEGWLPSNNIKILKTLKET